jgi:hypothetical protein
MAAFPVIWLLHRALAAPSSVIISGQIDEHADPHALVRLRARRERPRHRGAAD